MIAKPINSILLVCLGNICRSPLAEGVLRAVLSERGYGGDIVLDSAATGGWEVGSAPDPRSIAVASRHGIDISRQRARKIVPEDFHRFDLIFGMDRSNVRDLKALAAVRDRIHLFLDFAEGRPRDVPDPYYEDREAFASVYRMIREASEALATRLATRVSTPDSGQASSTT
ncbi:low molecular weight protein-tyrosine-phosphatase [Mesorhizobium sp. WSM3626]|uniref:low molecular weight protein-tyrosine-phosphatase n=1 Tax=Mesorhizobium sp. WSM3626 TaxID=1040987 RepID=UPI000A030A5B|nr:low molecular weight protein-tyrosine-phosphatase [Mesorhizobium sp. WSM3626]